MRILLRKFLFIILPLSLTVIAVIVSLYAANGKLSEAIKTSEDALRLAESMGKTHLAVVSRRFASTWIYSEQGTLIFKLTNLSLRRRLGP